MICGSCARGDHCGPPGVVGDRCFCQHRPPGTGQAGRPSLEITRGDASVIMEIGRQLSAAPGPVSRPVDDVPLPDPRTDASAPPEAPLRPFTEVLADWVRAHRAGRFKQAAALRRTMTDYLNRLGPDRG